VRFKTLAATSERHRPISTPAISDVTFQSISCCRSGWRRIKYRGQTYRSRVQMARQAGCRANGLVGWKIALPDPWRTGSPGARGTGLRLNEGMMLMTGHLSAAATLD